MKFRVIEQTNETFIVQKRIFFIWVTASEIGEWGCAFECLFGTKEAAIEYIKRKASPVAPKKKAIVAVIDI